MSVRGGHRSSFRKVPVCSAAPLFYDTPPVLFPRLSETKLLASTTHWPHAYLLLSHSEIETYFSVRPPRKTSATVLRTRTNKPSGHLNHGTIYSGTGLRRGEQDGSRCQHEFASLVCLSGASAEKNTAISLCSVQRLGAARRGSHQLLAVRPANTIICRFKRDALFSVPLFSNSTSAPCFFLNRKWDTSHEKLTKIWPTPMENSGFCDRICRIPRSLYRKLYLQDCFLVCHVFVMLIVFLRTKTNQVVSP